MKYINLNEVEKIYDAIPSVYNNTVNYNALDFDIHYIEGWRELVMPTFNEDTQFISGAYFLTSGTPYDYFTYPISDRTPEEVTVIIEAKEDNIDKAEFTVLIQEGNYLYLRHQGRLIRRVKRGALTQARAKTVRTLLIETYNLMTIGLIELASDRANAIPTQTNTGIQNEITWIREKLTELLTNFNPLRTL